MKPSIDSYGGSNVYLRYKNNKWFENINIIALKRAKASQEGELILELLDVGRKLEREELSEKNKIENKM